RADLLALPLLPELGGAGDGPAGREEVVDDQHAGAGLHGVLVHLEGRRSIFEVVFDADHVPGQLAELTDRYHPDRELVSDRRREDEPSRFHADDDVDLLISDLREQPVDRGSERLAVLEKRGDVLEEDSRFRKVWDVADTRSKVRWCWRHDRRLLHASGRASAGRFPPRRHGSRSRGAYNVIVGRAFALLIVTVVLAGCGGVQVPGSGAVALPNEFPADFPIPPRSNLLLASG